MGVTDRVEDARAVRDRLIRRFEATIPLRKPLIVTYTSIVGTKVLQATGLPHAVRGEVIYVMVEPRLIVGVPKLCVLAIEPLYPN